MRKAERLFQIITLMRGRRTAITAEQLAQALEVSVRTLYRDIQALILAGVPIEGEAGVGYRLRPGFQLPPLMFDPQEILALLVGTRMVRAFTDPQLAQASLRAEQKIRAILPEILQQKAEQQPYRIPVLARDEPLREIHGRLRLACEQRQKMQIDYTDEKGTLSRRVIWPLGMLGWGDRWTLLAWCELREDYRNFRFDRINAMEETGESFPQRADRSLRHYLDSILGAEGADQVAAHSRPRFEKRG